MASTLVLKLDLQLLNANIWNYVKLVANGCGGEVEWPSRSDWRVEGMLREVEKSECVCCYMSPLPLVNMNRNGYMSARESCGGGHPPPLPRLCCFLRIFLLTSRHWVTATGIASDAWDVGESKYFTNLIRKRVMSLCGGLNVTVQIDESVVAGGK